MDNRRGGGGKEGWKNGKCQRDTVGETDGNGEVRMKDTTKELTKAEWS